MPYAQIAGATPTAAVIGLPLTDTGETLETLRLRLVKMLASRTDLDKILLNGWINDAYTDVATMFEFEETQFQLTVALTVGQPFYKVPSNIDYTTGVTLQLPMNINFRLGQRLDKMDITTYRKLPDLTSTGQQAQLEPQRYMIYGDTLVVYPTPWTARSVVMDGHFVPRELVRDSDSPVLTREWHRAILLKARELVLEDNNSPQEALLAANNFTRYVQSRTSRKAMEKINRLSSVSVPGRQCNYDLGQNSGNPYVDMGDYDGLR